MCGRAYYTVTDEELSMRYLSRKPVRIPEHVRGLRPNYNLSPSQLTPVILVREGERTVDLFRWGLVPFWAKDEKIGYKMINARSETITEKPSFRAAFQRRRCIVPLSGFYEWQRQGDEKRPFAIYHPSEPVLSVAGIWETWTAKSPEDRTIHSFSILTTEANSFMSRVHDRMPVLLAQKDHEEWLDPGQTDSKELLRLLKPCPESWLERHEVSSAVNSPKNNREELLIPVCRDP